MMNVLSGKMKLGCCVVNVLTLSSLSAAFLQRSFARKRLHDHHVKPPCKSQLTVHVAPTISLST